MKERIVGVFSLAVLAGGYLVLRYPLFPLHGMKEWPLILFCLGAIIMIVFGFAFKRRLIPIATAIGYAAGFVFGYMFQFDYGFDCGYRQNNLWIIWSGVYLVTILVGIAVDFWSRKVTEA